MAAASARGGLPEESWEVLVCRDSLRLDLLSEVRKKGNLDRMLPPEPLLLRPPVAISGDGTWPYFDSFGGVFSIVNRISGFGDLQAGGLS